MKNLEVSKVLYEIADLLDMLGIEWKPMAFRKAARAIETLSKDIALIYKENDIKGLMEIPGVGEGIAKKIEEFLRTRRLKELEELRKKIPKGLSQIINIQGMGPKRAWKLYKKLKIDTVERLEKAAKEGKIRKLEGFGEKSEQDILRGIELLKRREERMNLGRALPIAESIAYKLRKLKSVIKVDVVGSIRRRKETVKDIDILVLSKKPKEVMDYFTKLDEVETVLSKGLKRTSVFLKTRINSDLRVFNEKDYGAAMNYFTGSKDHNVHLRQLALKKGWTLNEYGLYTVKGHKYLAGRSEEELYKKLGMPYIEPELRENIGEIEVAMQNRLPKLISYSAIKGDLHMHTRWSDGINSTEDMIKEAIKMDYEYIAITDHSKSTYVANGLDEKRLSERLKELDKLQKKFDNIRIFKGSEIDILANGSLDYSAKILEQLDFVIGSIHSRFKSPKEEMTKRIIKAVENKYINLIAHPTGRLINQRDPYEVDLDRIFQAAKDNNVSLEINSHPSRLDLQDVNIKKAIEFGVKLIINTDSHSTEHLKFIHLGIAQARRGWASEEDILNTLPLEKFEKIIQKK
ncbi:MAG: DNA polymerase/3'-5' exonuclease PolX [Nanoarchaeota archaeon]